MNRCSLTYHSCLKVALVTAILMGVHSTLFAQQEIPLWPEGEIPNIKGELLPDSIANERIYQVHSPKMMAFFPAQEENNGAAVLVIPGGGYNHISHVISGTQIAKWFNYLGINAFVLNYRLPKASNLENSEWVPLQDAQRAMRIIRARSSEWNIDAERVGVMGTSAGGHLASLLGTIDTDKAEIGDALDSKSFLPDFMILLSPVITMGEFTNEGSKTNLLGENPDAQTAEQFSTEKQVRNNTPPTILFHATDDHSVPPQNSILFYEALLEKNISASLHLFPSGEHAIRMKNPGKMADQWTHLTEAWLSEMGFNQPSGAN